MTWKVVVVLAGEQCEGLFSFLALDPEAHLIRTGLAALGHNNAIVFIRVKFLYPVR